MSAFDPLRAFVYSFRKEVRATSTPQLRVNMTRNDRNRMIAGAGALMMMSSPFWGMLISWDELSYVRTGTALFVILAPYALILWFALRLRSSHPQE